MQVYQMKSLLECSLGLFFTSGVGLSTWEKTGGIERELAIYKKLLTHLKSVTLITYGGNQDRLMKKYLGNLGHIPSNWLFSDEITAGALYIKNHWELKNIDIFKTNQMVGSHVPLLLKKFMKAKCIVRCGYLYAHNLEKELGPGKITSAAKKYEKKSFKEADHSILTAPWQKDWVVNEYSIVPEKISIVPNFVDTDIFRPLNRERVFDVSFIGRCSKEKNLVNLVKAVESISSSNRKISMHMIGSCAMDDTFRKLINKCNADITFTPNVPNSQLPELLNKSRLFILPSMFEGHPKALIEAMSCGLPCIGTNVPGIRESIEHGKTGLLCLTEVKGIAQAIETVLHDEQLQKDLGKAAREYIINNYSFNKILDLELNVLQDVIKS